MTAIPENVRAVVAGIEREIGEEEPAERPIEGSAAEPAGVHTDRGTGPVEDAVRQILEEIGEDPARDGLVGTPQRVHRMYTELTAGYHVDPERLVNDAIFDVD